MVDKAGSEVTKTLGNTQYIFRVPDLYDPPKIRRLLTRQRVRRPSPLEFKVAALAGIRGMAEAVGDTDEGERQCALIEEWYDLLEPVDEHQIDEPDPVKRAQEMERLEAERRERRQGIYPEVQAIEANLERHHQPYAELLSDRLYWDDVSRIEAVRLLLVGMNGTRLSQDDDGMLSPAEYQALAKDHRVPLATIAFGLLAPDETQRKN